MFSNVVKWLNKPYYFNKSIFFRLFISFGLGGIVFIFLFILKPKGIDKIALNPYLFRLGYAVNTSLILLLYFFVVTKLFPDYYNNEVWTIKKQLINITGIMVMCSIVHWIYSLSVLSKSHYIQYVSFLEILFYTTVLGIAPSTIFIYFNEKYSAEKLDNIGNEIPTIQNKKVTIIVNNEIPKKVTIYASNKKDSITFDIDSLLYITSENNYACFFLNDKENNVKERILRLPLHLVEAELTAFNHILRCHKSYIVNTNYVSKIAGNTKGYSLEIEKKLIPCSRKFKKEDLINLIWYNE